MKYFPAVAIALVLLVLTTRNCGRHEEELIQSSDSLDTRVDSLAAVIDSLRRDTIVVTRIIRRADSVAYQAEQDEILGDTVAALGHWRSAYDAEREARLNLTKTLVLVRDTLVPAMTTQVNEALRQRDEWRSVARPGMLSLRRIRPVVGCVTNFSGSACGVGVAYHF